MKRISAIMAALLVSGCALTPTQKKIAGAIAGVLIVGAIAAHDEDGDSGQVFQNRTPTPNVDCASNPQTCR